MNNGDNITFTTEGVYNRDTGEAGVRILFGAMDVIIPTMSAREIGMKMIDTAHAAEGDAFLVGFLKDRYKEGPEAINNIMDEFRRYRIRQNGEQ